MTTTIEGVCVAARLVVHAGFALIRPGLEAGWAA
jgi:hypothetical protein